MKTKNFKIGDIVNEKCHILLNQEALKLLRLTIKKGKFYEDDVNDSYAVFIGKSLTEKRAAVNNLRALNDPQWQEAVMKHVDMLIANGNYNLPLNK